MLLPPLVQEQIKEDASVSFQDIPPSWWLYTSDNTYTLDDFDPSDEEYDVLKYVLQVIEVPIVPPNIWEAIGDITTSECRYRFIVQFIVLYIMLHNQARKPSGSVKATESER